MKLMRLIGVITFLTFPSGFGTVFPVKAQPLPPQQEAVPDFPLETEISSCSPSTLPPSSIPSPPEFADPILKLVWELMPMPQPSNSCQTTWLPSTLTDPIEVPEPLPELIDTPIEPTSSLPTVTPELTNLFPAEKPEKIPEPSSVVGILALGVLGATSLRRRQRKSDDNLTN